MVYPLLIISVVLILCILLTKVSNRLGVPMLLAFMVLGMVFGSDGLFKIPFDNSVVMENIATIALIFIIFYGGFGTKWSTAKPVLAKSILLSTLGVLLTALFVGLFCHYILNIPLLISFLLGAVISSTDAASVFSILRSKKLNLKYGTASILELESGSNDPAAYMLTIILITLLTGDFNAVSFIYLIFSQIIYGIAAGFILSFIAVKIFKNYIFSSAGMKMIFLVSCALLSYALPAHFNGNGYLSAYIVGIILGNTHIEDKKPLVYFFDGITDLMQMLLFFLLGLLSFPSVFPEYALYALIIALFLTFIARPLSVFILLMPLKAKINQQILISFAGLRGAASIVFAIMAQNSLNSNNMNSDTIFNIVFLIVLFSIIFQGSLIPFAANKLKMIDDSEDVMKTFTDYSDTIPVEFIEFAINKNHKWNNKLLKDITLPPETIIAMIKRGNEKIVPNGNTVFLSGDIVILCGKSGASVEGVKISENRVTATSSLVGKQILDIKTEKNMVVLVILRDNNILIPKGDTVIEKDDLLIIHHT